MSDVVDIGPLCRALGIPLHTESYGELFEDEQEAFELSPGEALPRCYPPIDTDPKWTPRVMEAACRSVAPKKALDGSVALLVHNFEVYPPVNAELWEVEFDIESGFMHHGEGETLAAAVFGALESARKAGAFGTPEEKKDSRNP